MTAQEAMIAVENPVLTQNDLLVLGLSQTGQLACLKRIGAKYGFKIMSRWESAAESMKQTLENPSPSNPNATYQNLRRIAIKIITSCNNVYSIDKITNSRDAAQLTNLKNFKDFIPSFAAVFPAKLEEDTGLTVIPGHHITAIETMADGIAIIYSYVLLRKVTGSKKMQSTLYPTQYFNTVFIPNDLSRIEYRVDRSIGRRHTDSAMAGLRDNFISFLSAQKILLGLESVNFYDVIDNIFKDKKYGRIVQADFMDITDGDDAQLRCRTNPEYDARECEVSKKSSKGHYNVCGVAVRFDFVNREDKYHNEIGFEPNKADWLNRKFCGSFYFEQPSDDLTHFGVINDILVRAKA
ncbi:TPA: hypothetical protein U5E23_003538 [Yersinia enterocolitica]|nr:hypothetical protein [Yersinia enterocolitica]